VIVFVVVMMTAAGAPSGSVVVFFSIFLMRSNEDMTGLS
jgi:hypothetical protein